MRSVFTWHDDDNVLYQHWIILFTDSAWIKRHFDQDKLKNVFVDCGKKDRKNISRLAIPSIAKEKTSAKDKVFGYVGLNKELQSFLGGKKSRKRKHHRKKHSKKRKTRKIHKR